jgi:hypothetical protein
MSCKMELKCIFIDIFAFRTRVVVLHAKVLALHWQAHTLLSSLNLALHVALQRKVRQKNGADLAQGRIKYTRELCS